VALPELRKAEVEGKTVAYREAGSGPALVWLHGIGSNSESWEPQFADLSKDWRVIAWDAPGYGDSDDLEPLGPLAGDYAEALAGLLDSLKIGRAHVGGNSLGALMAAAFWNRHPDRVLSLILSDAASGHGRLSAEERQEKLMQRLDDVAELGAAGLAQKRGPALVAPSAPPHVVAKVVRGMSRIRPKGYIQAARMLSLGDILRELAGCDVPVLVICGAEDRITPPPTNKRIAEAVAGARFELLSGAGHLPNLEAPDRFNALVRDFLGSLGTDAVA
jgi:pimeloyl-ACP methyl ester carboxylesterase